MENNSLKFKTTINCANCVATVKPVLDALAGLETWAVDTTNKDKVLTIKLAGANETQVVQAVQQAGFKIERI